MELKSTTNSPGDPTQMQYVQKSDKKSDGKAFPQVVPL